MQRTLLEIIQNTDELSTLEDGIVLSGIDAFFNIPFTDYTVFAPPNDAFDEFGADYVNLLFTDLSYGLHLNNLIAYHIARDEYFAAALVQLANSGIALQMLSLERVNFAFDMVDLSLISSAPFNSTVTKRDVDARDGVLHFVDQVLWPKFMTLNPLSSLDEFNIWNKFKTMITAANRDTFLTLALDITLIAPNDAGIESSTLDFLLLPENFEILDQVVNYNIVESVFNFRVLDVGNEISVATRQGERLTFTRMNIGDIRIGGEISRQFALVERGIVYEVQGLLVPPSLAAVIPGI